MEVVLFHFSLDSIEYVSVLDKVEILFESLFLIIFDHRSNQFIHEFHIVENHQNVICLVDCISEGTQERFVIVLKPVGFKNFYNVVPLLHSP